jgi:predicted NUDIX family NTP pyrophosphohydrolase
MSSAGLSAGIVLHRAGPEGLEVLLILPGGPYWASRDVGAWQIPKGGIEEGESPEQAALREYREELGVRPTGKPRLLGQIRQSGGKRVTAFAIEGDFDVETLVSIHFDLEWPPKSGNHKSFPEVARARWFTMADARANILPSQSPLLDRLEALLAKESR